MCLLWFAYGRLHLAQEQTAEAFHYLEKAQKCHDAFLRLAPPVTSNELQITLCYNLAICLLDSNPTQAKSYLKQIVAMNKGTPITKLSWATLEVLASTYYFLAAIDNVFKRKKWAQKLWNVLEYIDRIYPEEFLRSTLYTLLVEDGIISP